MSRDDVIHRRPARHLNANEAWIDRLAAEPARPSIALSDKAQALRLRATLPDLSA